MNKIKIFEILTIISAVGMIAWNVTDYFGGMIIHLLQYWYLIIPVLVLYVGTLVGTFIKVALTGFKANKFAVFVHLSFFVIVLCMNLVNFEIFKSKKVLRGTLKDDLFHCTLTFREDGTCENQVSGFMGFEKKYKGNYIMKGDTIIFSVVPYNNDFLPDTLLIDRIQNVIFLNKNKNGKFSTEKEWLNHFQLE